MQTHTYSTPHLLTDDEDAAIVQQYRQEQPWGLVTSIDVMECDPALIRSREHIETFVDTLCRLIDMKTFGPTVIVDFGEEPRVAGFSMTQLIETSLISGHFANQSNTAYIDIFSCKAYSPAAAANHAKTFFAAQHMRVAIHFRY